MRGEKRYNPCVVRALRWILAALLVFGIGACAEVDDPVDSGLLPEAGPVPKDAGPACAVTKVVDLDDRQADVLILLDRSGSMDTAFGSGTRYQAVAGLLSDLVATYAEHVRFGYQEMPGRQDCVPQVVPGCCASRPLVGIAENDPQAVETALASASPMDGNTPTAASLQAALAYYESLADGVESRYVLLATDGAPNCTLAGGLSSGDPSGTACTDALAVVNAMVALGVRVIVLGVGAWQADATSGDAACLDALAHAGGAAASPGNPGFFAASDPQTLQLAIEQIFGGVTRPTCVLHFLAPVANPSTISVYLDGQQIPRDLPDGWYLDTSLSPPSAHITGAACEQIQRFQVSVVEARFDCPPCVDIQGC